MTREDDLTQRARAWIAGDPDPDTRAELESLLAAPNWTRLADQLAPLSFGTAGLRGPVGAGPGRMNTALVIRTAAGIARYVREELGAPGSPIVIGYDARPTSRRFAEASAGVLLAAGHRVVSFVEPVATPLVAFFGLRMSAAMTVVVTASHNPRGDNGYKVYGPNGVQIVSPVDTIISSHIDATPPARDVPRIDVDFAQSLPAGLELLERRHYDPYFELLAVGIPASSSRRDLRIVHSALHGVGTAPLLRALSDAGFTGVSVVAEQAEPDGSFPTTPFPNPEEPGTLDLALATAERRAASLVLVNDPDADRLSAAARLDGALTVLDGNQVGALLADDCLARAPSAGRPLVLTSVVSSPLVELLCKARGARHERTHTGFKWLWSAALALEDAGEGAFCFAYEEALGYSVLRSVRDKDGISAGRALAEIAARLAERGLTLFDRLFELYREHGLWASAARQLGLTGADASLRVAKVLDALAQSRLPLVGPAVVRVTDYRTLGASRPPWLGVAPLLELEFEQGARVFVRPSGTEPKLKLYAHVRHAVSHRAQLAAAIAAARAEAAELLRQLGDALQTTAGSAASR